MTHIKRRSRRSALAFLTMLVLAINCTFAVDAQKKKSRAKQPVYYTVPTNTTLHVRLDQELDSEQNRGGDTFTATVVDPVYSSGGVLLIPQGSTVNGRVTNVSRAGKGGDPATLDVQFVSVALPNGDRRAINGSLSDLESSGGKSNNEGTVSANKTK